MLDAAESRKLERLIQTNGFRATLRELQMIAFSRIGNGNPNWELYYTELGTLLSRLENTIKENGT